MLESFLSTGDAARGRRALEKLAHHDIGSWVLTGGWAVEIHHCLRGKIPCLRALNDIDFIAGSFDCLPGTLADEYLFRHVHPADPPGKTMLQAIDAEERLRIDVFRACGNSLQRAGSVPLCSAGCGLIALQDLTARTARLVLDLADAVPVPRKHGRDFLRLAALVDAHAVDPIWQEHKRPRHPLSFREVTEQLISLICSREDLLIMPRYSTDAAQVCHRCAATPLFELADPKRILSLLGYC